MHGVWFGWAGWCCLEAGRAVTVGKMEFVRMTQKTV